MLNDFCVVNNDKGELDLVKLGRIENARRLGGLLTPAETAVLDHFLNTGLRWLYLAYERYWDHREDLLRRDGGTIEKTQRFRGETTTVVHEYPPRRTASIALTSPLLAAVRAAARQAPRSREHHAAASSRSTSSGDSGDSSPGDQPPPGSALSLASKQAGVAVAA